MSATTSVPDKRTAAQITADLERSRMELTATVQELITRIDPKSGLEEAKVLAHDKVRVVREQAKEKFFLAKAQGEKLIEDAKTGDKRALGIIGGAAGASLLVAGVIIWKARE